MAAGDFPTGVPKQEINTMKSALRSTLLAAACAVGLAFTAPLVPHALAAGAAFFLYLSLADLVPRHRRSASTGEALWQAGLVLAGALLILLLPAHG